MITKIELDEQIEYLRGVLSKTFELNNCDLLHPNVVDLSKKLDFLILKWMKRSSGADSSVN